MFFKKVKRMLSSLGYTAAVLALVVAARMCTDHCTTSYDKASSNVYSVMMSVFVDMALVYRGRSTLWVRKKLCPFYLYCNFGKFKFYHGQNHKFSECPDVKNYKWQLNLVWHTMLFSCTHLATVDVKWSRLRVCVWCDRRSYKPFSLSIALILSTICHLLCYV